MADSGLETGSLSPLENSESSVTDFEVSHADRVSMDDVDFISVGLNGEAEDAAGVWKKTELSSSSSSSPPPASLDPATAGTNARTDNNLRDDTNQAGIVVSLVDEKCKETDSNAYHCRDNSFLLRKESFEFIDTKRKNNTGTENQCSPPRCSNDLGNNGGNTSSYYFIDASSLNDNELLEEPIRESVVSDETSGADGRSKISDSKITSTVGPSEKPMIEKETLVVEIKEADSGESGQPSPCLEEAKRTENPPAATTATSFEETDSRRGSLLIRRNTFELDPNDEKLSVLRQEYERRQGHLVFQNAIPQYSGHRVDGDSCFEPSDHSELAANLLVSSTSSTSTPPIITLAATKYGVDALPRTNILVESINKITNVPNYREEQQRIANNTQNRDPTSYERRSSGCWLYTGDSDQASSKEVGTSEIRGSISRGSPEGTTPSSRSSERERGLCGIAGGPENACPISESSSDKLFLESCSESDDGSRNCCNSLPITLNDQRQIARERRSSVNCRTQRERTKRDETTPILSGGVSTADYVKPTESPATKRRIESTPIVSGGSVLANDMYLDDSTAVAKPPTRMASSMTAAWVVDMSDCTKNSSSPVGTSVSTASSKLASNGQPIMSKSFSSSSDCVATANRKNVKRTRACETKHASLGFFVNLNDIETREEREKSEQERTKKGAAALESGGGKHSCEFFVDISRKEENGTGGARGSGSSTNGEESGAGSRNSGESTNGKKNIFSMFIDFREPKKDNRGSGGGDDDDDDDGVIVSSGRPEEKPRDSKCLSKLTSGDFSGGESSSSSQLDRAERIKPTSVFMFIESDSPVVRRRALSSSRPAAFQRHSWNVVEKAGSITPTTNLKKDCPLRREHKRAHSVSVDRTDLRTLHTKASNSSHSLSQVARADVLNGSTGNLPKRSHDHESSGRNTDTSTEEVFEYDTRDTPPNSHVEIVDKETEGLVLGGIVGKSNGLFKKDDAVELEEKGPSKMQQRKQELDPEIGDSNIKPYEDECGSEVSAWEKTGTESTTEGNTRKSETFDISSGASGASPESDNNNHYHLEDIRGEVTNYDATSALLDENVDVDSGGGGLRIVLDRVSETHKSLTETIKKIESELKKPEFEVDTATRDDKPQETSTASASSFVRLSDLDATPLRSSRTSDVPSRERENENVYHRMSNSIPETSWVESKLAFNRNNNNSSVRALPRKFTTIMSTSLPAKHKSPIEDATECEADAAIISESDLSSMQSSMGRSGADVSTEETETWSMGVTKPYNRLGEDLLRMFLEEINPDVTIDVGGRKIRAHKCILSSRCQYFAAILSGGWIESAGNVITLQGYSYNAVHFALCHIYSGESDIPETLSIVELATLADMLCLEGLKEVIGYTLKVKYCHLFHKPCQVCAVGVLECMPLAAAYGLDEVYRKSLRWITRHFVRIWPCKAFAALPRELMDKCYHQHIVHMSADNVLQTMMDCDKLLATLPNVRWAEPVFRMVSNLLETAVKYISDNFSSILGNDNFQALGRDLTWNISRLEENFLAAADRLSPDQACKSYAKINKMLSSVQQHQQQPLQQAVKQHSSSCPPSAWSPLFVDFLRKIQTRVEKCLVKEASRAARTTTWLKMDLELRRRIQELACLVILPHEALKRPSRHSNFLKEPRIPPTRTPADRSLDLRRVKVAISEQQKDTGGFAAGTKRGVSASIASAPGTAAGQQVKKSLPVKPRSDPLERKNPHEAKQQQQLSGTAVTAVALDSSIATRPRSWPNKLEVKSRYLEPPRNKSVPKDTPQQSHHERVMVQQRRKIIISSSDSSRTSSPAMKRAIDKKPLAKIKLTIKKDARALSSDSLTEATSTSGRLTNKKDPVTASKSCGITRPESPSFKQNDPDIGLSTDSLAEPRKKKPQHPLHSTTAPAVGKKKQQPIKLTDTWMSTDSLMNEIGTTPKSSSNQSNKVPPATGKTAVSTTTTTTTIKTTQVKKFSPPMQQKNTTTTTATTVRGRLPRSLECSTAASRNRAAATISAYHGSPNLRRNLLDAAKTPDIPTKGSNGVVTMQNSRSTFSNATSTANHSSSTTGKREKSLSNQPSTESPSKKSSPKSNGNTRRSVRAANPVSVPPSTKKQQLKGNEEKPSKLKCHNGDAAAATKQPTVGSRSGTFLKDEPTILKKSDIRATAVAPATAQQITTT
ncbi:uncharacterized protein [Venturia canescens]|nr:uncharacterized protein LOC122411961 isoform X2 [Venturia canescens]